MTFPRFGRFLVETIDVSQKPLRVSILLLVLVWLFQTGFVRSIEIVLVITALGAALGVWFLDWLDSVFSSDEKALNEYFESATGKFDSISELTFGFRYPFVTWLAVGIVIQHSTGSYYWLYAPAVLVFSACVVYFVTMAEIAYLEHKNDMSEYEGSEYAA